MDYPRIGERCWAQTLPCGLPVRIIPKAGFAQKRAFLAVNYGSIDTAFSLGGVPHRTPDGIAHYLEHKMFDLPEGSAANFFAATGASPNAFTSYDMTAYYFSCTDAFDENLRLLLRMVLTPYFTEESVEKERGIIAQEIRMYEDSPDSRVNEDLLEILYASHPVRVPIAGTVESIGHIRAEDLYDCHRAFYRPENMVLCVVGDVDPQHVMELVDACVQKHEAPLPMRDYGAPEAMRPLRAAKERRMEVSMPTFALGFKAESIPFGQDSLRASLVGAMASDLLMGDSSPLFESLYDTGLINSEFGSGFDSGKGSCVLIASGDSRDPQAVCAAVLKEAERIRAEGIDTERFTRLLRAQYGSYLRAIDSFDRICYRICSGYFSGADALRFPEAFEHITPQSILQFIDTVVRPERMALAVVRQEA